MGALTEMRLEPGERRKEGKYTNASNLQASKMFVYTKRFFAGAVQLLRHIDKVSVVIPTYNAGSQWHDLQAGLGEQGVLPSQVLIVDSSSTDDTRTLAKNAGYKVLRIKKEEFNHGATRQLASTYLAQSEFLVFMTQDAILARADALEELCRPFDNPQIGAVYGRQVARHNADPIERHGRLYNYPAISETRNFDSRKELGFRVAFFSNSFAVYRRAALEGVGGFSADTIVSEEVTAVAKMLIAGWDIAYQAEAVAIHSHPLSLFGEFSRYFDIGVHHGHEAWLLQTFGTATGSGWRFVIAETRYLLTHAPAWLPYSALRLLSRFIAYRLGTFEKHLPKAFCQRLSGHPSFWNEVVLRSGPVMVSQPRKNATAAETLYPDNFRVEDRDAV